MTTLFDNLDKRPSVEDRIISGLTAFRDTLAEQARVTKYQSHSATSREAAQSIAPTAKTLRAKVLEYIASKGERGATDEEVQLGLGMNPSTQRPRRVELAERDLITKHGQRPTKSGLQAAVWVACERKSVAA